jgi:hypothetical protein
MADAESTRKIMKEKARIKKPFMVRVISNNKENLDILSKNLSALCGVHPRINSSVSGQDIQYFELSINKKNDVRKLIDSGFLPSQKIAKINSSLFKPTSQ